jgi:hypothetical protein
MAKGLSLLFGVAMLLPVAGKLLLAAQGQANLTENIPVTTSVTSNAGTITRQGGMLRLQAKGDVRLTSTRQMHTAVLTCQDMSASGSTIADSDITAEDDMHFSLPLSERDGNGVEKQLVLTMDAHEMSKANDGTIILTGHNGVQPHVRIMPQDTRDKEFFDLKADSLVLNTEAESVAKDEAVATALHVKKFDAARLTNSQLVGAIASAVKDMSPHLCLKATGAAVVSAILHNTNVNAKETAYQKLAGKADLITGEFAARTGADAADAPTPMVLAALFLHLRGSDATPCRMEIFDADPQTKDFQTVPSTRIVAQSLDLCPEAKNNTQTLWGANKAAKMATSRPLPTSFSENILHADHVIDFTTLQILTEKPTNGKKSGMTLDFTGAKQWIGHNGRIMELNLLPASVPDRLADTQFLWLRGEIGASSLEVFDVNDAQHPKVMMSTRLNMLADLDAGTFNAVEGDPRVALGAQP